MKEKLFNIKGAAMKVKHQLELLPQPLNHCNCFVIYLWINWKSWFCFSFSSFFNVQTIKLLEVYDGTIFAEKLQRKCFMWPQIPQICSNSIIETLEKGVKYSSKFTIKSPEWRYWRCSSVFIVNFEHI